MIDRVMILLTAALVLSAISVLARDGSRLHRLAMLGLVLVLVVAFCQLFASAWEFGRG